MKPSIQAAEPGVLSRMATCKVEYLALIPSTPPVQNSNPEGGPKGADGHGVCTMVDARGYPVQVGSLVELIDGLVVEVLDRFADRFVYSVDGVLVTHPCSCCVVQNFEAETPPEGKRSAPGGVSAAFAPEKRVVG